MDNVNKCGKIFHKIHNSSKRLFLLSSQAAHGQRKSRQLIMWIKSVEFKGTKNLLIHVHYVDHFALYIGLCENKEITKYLILDPMGNPSEAMNKFIYDFISALEDAYRPTLNTKTKRHPIIEVLKVCTPSSLRFEPLFLQSLLAEIQ